MLYANPVLQAMNEVSLGKAVLSTDVVFYTLLVYEGFGKYLMTPLMANGRLVENVNRSHSSSMFENN